MIHASGSTLKPYLHTHIRIHTLMHTPHTRITHICTLTHTGATGAVCRPLPHASQTSLYDDHWAAKQERGETHCTCTYMYMLERCRRKRQARSYKQQRKATQHTKAVTFPKRKKELPRVYMYMYVLVLVLFAYNYYTCICTHILYMCIHVHVYIHVN